MIPFYAVPQEEGTEAMVAAGLSPGAGAMAAPEIIIAGECQANWQGGSLSLMSVVPINLCPLHSRSQGGGYGDRSSGGSYRDSYDSYGKSHSRRSVLPWPVVGAVTLASSVSHPG